MKTIVLWSRTTDRKLLKNAGAVCALALTALIGSALPTPGTFDWLPLFDAFLATVFLVFVWSSFRVIRPKRYSRGWTIAEAITVPLLWVVLVTALGFWFSHLRSTWEMRLNERQVLILKPQQPAGGSQPFRPAAYLAPVPVGPHRGCWSSGQMI